MRAAQLLCRSCGWTSLENRTNHLVTCSDSQVQAFSANPSSLPGIICGQSNPDGLFKTQSPPHHPASSPRRPRRRRWPVLACVTNGSIKGDERRRAGGATRSVRSTRRRERCDIECACDWHRHEGLVAGRRGGTPRGGSVAALVARSWRRARRGGSKEGLMWCSHVWMDGRPPAVA